MVRLAKNLYTSSARFVFELLQNADDNSYQSELARGGAAYVGFEIYHDRIVIECNEDGFSQENLKAISAIGKSSKVATQGYIGEKGIGFKSVFMAAWKVHIQSNDFSFSFTHRKGDSGLGMVTPVWTDPEQNLDQENTRITLFLHVHEDPEENKRQRDTINSQFRDLQDTILLFLRKMRTIYITFYDQDGYQELRTTYSLEGENPVIIKKQMWNKKTGAMKTTKKWYHVTKHTARNLPKSENRSYPDDEPHTDASAEIVLAFPLTETSSPIVENQDVFAFLPMRPMGFKASGPSFGSVGKASCVNLSSVSSKAAILQGSTRG